MSLRVLFLSEGTSDVGIATHIERLAAEDGIEVALTSPNLDRLPDPPGQKVAAKLQAVVDLGGEYDLVAIHRDADNQGREARCREIRDAVQSVMASMPHVPVIPVRMTEAWLLTDEDLIRRVAGNPRGRVRLDLPPGKQAESLADPKGRLKELLAVASETTGRRLERFNQRFSEHRRQLLELLDPNGPVSSLPSWQHFVSDVKAGLKRASA